MIDVEYNREKVEEGKRLGCSWIVEEWDQSGWVHLQQRFSKWNELSFLSVMVEFTSNIFNKKAFWWIVISTKKLLNLVNEF